MMSKITSIALIGAGCRGKDAYATAIYKEKMAARFVAVVDPIEEKRQNMMDMFDIGSDMAFEKEDDFFSKGKICDAVIIATQDRDHYRQVMKALDLGYDIILEKPISTNLEEILKIEKKAIETKNKVIVCHVLRYHSMWNIIKKILDKGELGKIMTIQHNENIGHYHMSHSFVRGEWRNSDTSGPIILTKSSHDLDILVWLTGSKGKSIASFGGIGFFKEENAPKGSADKCFDCKLRQDCQYDGMKVYTSEGGYSPQIFTNNKYTTQAIEDGLKNTQYGKCIWKSGNNVCDNQVTIIEMENGVTITFNLNAFTRDSSRTIKIMCEQGEIRANEEEIEVTFFKMRNKVLGTIINKLKLKGDIKKTYKVHKRFNSKRKYGHNGADYYFVKDFVEVLNGEEISKSSISKSVESHLMAFAAEESRKTNRVIDINMFKQENYNKIT